MDSLSFAPESPANDLALAFVGTLVPDAAAFQSRALHRASQVFQGELVFSLQKAGLPSIDVLSIEPIPAFPRSRRLLGRRGVLKAAHGIQVRLLPFFNVHPLKAITVAAATFARLVLWAWQRRGRKRLIYCVNLTMPPGMALLAAARVTRSRIMASLLDVWRPGELVPDTWARRLDYRLQRFLIPRLDGLCVVSDAIARDLAPGRTVCRVEGGIVPASFPPMPESQSGPSVSSGPFRVVLAGAMEEYNGVQLALAAFELLDGHYELVVAGRGSYDDIVQRAATANPRIRWKGYIPFADLLQEYRSADLLLNVRVTTTIDTRYFFPSKLMELLASGTPVLSTCTGHVEEEFASVLYLLREETPAGLAAAIAAIANDPERRARGARAREFMLQNKTWDAQGQRLLRYIRDEVFAERPKVP
jgi:glycosyltransferase involved in cell wall biosynthesis